MESRSNASKLVFNPTNWLPRWAHPASGHRHTPSLVRNGHNASQTLPTWFSLLFSSDISEIDTDTSELFPCLSRLLGLLLLLLLLFSRGASSTSDVVKLTLQPSDCTALVKALYSLVARFADSRADQLIRLSLSNSALNDSIAKEISSTLLSVASLSCFWMWEFKPKSIKKESDEFN